MGSIPKKERRTGCPGVSTLPTMRRTQREKILSNSYTLQLLRNESATPQISINEGTVTQNEQENEGLYRPTPKVL